MRPFALIALLSPILASGETVSLNIFVHDELGRGVEGARIALETPKKTEVLYQKTEYHSFTCETGSDGKATKCFSCYDGEVLCTVSADGYYGEDLPRIQFKVRYDAEKRRYEFTEKSRSVDVLIRKIINPTTMCWHRVQKGIRPMPSSAGSWGYDLEKGDWVRPFGKGEIADINIVYELNEDLNRIECKGSIEFEGKGAGGYVGKVWPCSRFRTPYRAVTNGNYETSFPFLSRLDKQTNCFSDKQVLSEDEYMVIRTRVVLDEKGRIVKANYTHIQGPFSIGRYLEIRDCYFNPTPNDTNLEPKR